MRTVTAQVSLGIHAVMPEPSLFAHTIEGTEEASDKEPGIWPHWMAVLSHFKDR